MPNELQQYNYNIQAVQNFGQSLQQGIRANTNHYLEVTKTGDFEAQTMDSLLKLKSEVVGMPAINQNPILKFFGKNSLVKKIEQSKTKLTSVQDLLSKIEAESNNHLKQIENNVNDSTKFLDDTKKYIDEAENSLKTLEDKIQEVEADNNPDKVAKDFYLQELHSKHDEISSAIAMLVQQREQVSALRGASVVSAQKLHATINISVPLLASQLAQAVMVMKLEQSNKTIDDLSNSLTELTELNTKNWSNAMIRTAEQQKEGVINIDAIEKNRLAIAETADKILAIQQQSNPQQVEKLSNELKFALDTFHKQTTTPQIAGAVNQSQEYLGDMPTMDDTKL